MKKIFLPVLLFILIAAYLTAPVDFILTHQSLVANFLIAEYAHVRAGEVIPFDPGYKYDQATMAWGTVSNSPWLIDWVIKIVPSLVVDKISVGTGVYPASVGFIPEKGSNSFHIAGFAQPSYMAIWLNDRYAIDPTWNDEREALSTLTHELIHIQGGTYLSGASEEFEPHTQAASTEALAGMCNQGLELACSAFWYDVESYARTELRLELSDLNWGDWYNRIANLLWRDASDERAAARSARFWADDPTQLNYIFRAYSLKPWEMILSGVNDDVYLNTGLDIYYDAIHPWLTVIQGMPFDDTQALFAPIVWLVQWAN